VYTLVILSVVIAAVVGLQDKIQLVLFVSGGLFGVLLSVSFPCLFVIFGRRIKKQ
jgi:Na+(H+)/acetate symporter ActP